jgi:hypothetical protein
MPGRGRSPARTAPGPAAARIDDPRRGVPAGDPRSCDSWHCLSGIQLFASFTRFVCKLFLADALRYFGGAAHRCMIDNTHVVVLHGTGRDMVPVPEMAAFADRYGFTFAAHEKGDANRSARVERPFDFIEHNFLAGRDFRDLDDLDTQALAWCDKVNATHRRHLHASPRELFAVSSLISCRCRSGSPTSTSSTTASWTWRATSR